MKELPPKTMLRRQLAARFPLPLDLHHEGDYTESQAAVLEVIARENFEHGVCQHTRSSLAEMSGTGPATVTRTLEIASEQGILSIQQVEGRAPDRIIVTSPVWKAYYAEQHERLKRDERLSKKITKVSAKRRRASKLRP